jgi:hypothetical protein
MSAAQVLLLAVCRPHQGLADPEKKVARAHSRASDDMHLSGSAPLLSFHGEFLLMESNHDVAHE